MQKSLINKESNTGCFPVNIMKFLRTPILKNICEWLLQSLIFLIFLLLHAWGVPVHVVPKDLRSSRHFINASKKVMKDFARHCPFVTEHKMNANNTFQRTSWTSSERLTYVQFTSCAQEVIIFLMHCKLLWKNVEPFFVLFGDWGWSF